MKARRVTGWVLGMLMIGVLSVRPVSAQNHEAPIDVSGAWEFSLMDMAWSLELTVDGHDISGELVIVGFGDFVMDRVELDGDELLVWVSAGGNHLEFVGTVEGDEYVGEMSGFHGEAPISIVAVRESS